MKEKKSKKEPIFLFELESFSPMKLVDVMLDNPIKVVSKFIVWGVVFTLNDKLAPNKYVVSV